jgi:hypothetical protein
MSVDVVVIVALVAGIFTMARRRRDGGNTGRPMYYSRRKIRKPCAARFGRDFSTDACAATAYAPKALRAGGNTVISTSAARRRGNR